jgi:hypothetical protein
LFAAVFKSAGNFPTEFSAENEKKTAANIPAIIRR